MKLLFRNLQASDIAVVPCCSTTDEESIHLMLKKTEQCDYNFLDDTVGIGLMNWKSTYPTNTKCIVSLYDEERQQWIEKEAVGESDEDAFHKCCVLWGIGRELVPIPVLEYPKRYLPDPSLTKVSWSVDDVTYSKAHSIQSVTICATDMNVLAQTKVIYSAEDNFQYPKFLGSLFIESEEKPESLKKVNPYTFADDEKIIIGNCSGRTFGQVKNSELFASFLRWTKTTNTTYNDAAKMEQLCKFRLFAIQNNI